MTFLHHARLICSSGLAKHRFLSSSTVGPDAADGLDHVASFANHYSDRRRCFALVAQYVFADGWQNQANHQCGNNHCGDSMAPFCVRGAWEGLYNTSASGTVVSKAVASASPAITKGCLAPRVHPWRQMAIREHESDIMPPQIPGTPGAPENPEPDVPQEPTPPDGVPSPIDPDPYPKYRDEPPPTSID